MNTSIVKIAASQIGVKEIVGGEHNDTIVQYAKDIGLTWINDDETPWCATFVNWVLKRCGYQYKSSARARDFESYGTPAQDPQPGDIVVFWRESISSGKGHVGFLWGYSKDGGYIFVLGGNQGNQVTITKYGLSNILGFRRVVETDTLEIPKAPLRKGDKGGEVNKLQEILKYFNLYSIKVDGDFGNGTVEGVKKFQQKYGLSVTGEYDTSTHDKIFTLLNE